MPPRPKEAEAQAHEPEADEQQDPRPQIRQYPDPEPRPGQREERHIHRQRPAFQLATQPLAFHRRSEEHTSELQSPCNLVCRLLLEKKNINRMYVRYPLLSDHLRRQNSSPRRNLDPPRAPSLDVNPRSLIHSSLFAHLSLDDDRIHS